MERIMHVQDVTGDTQYDLDTQTNLAEEVFSKAIKEEGKMAYAFFENVAIQVFEFPETETAEKVVVIPQYVGG